MIRSSYMTRHGNNRFSTGVSGLAVESADISSRDSNTTHPRTRGCAHQAPKKSCSNLDVAASARHGGDGRMRHGRQAAYSAFTAACKVTSFFESVLSQGPNRRYSPIDAAQGTTDFVPAGTSVFCIHQHASVQAR